MASATRRNAPPSRIQGLVTKVITGVTAAAEGGLTLVPHGIVRENIASWVSTVTHTPQGGVAQAHASPPGFQFQASLDDTNAILRLHATNSENLLSKPFTFLIWYAP